MITVLAVIGVAVALVVAHQRGWPLRWMVVELLVGWRWVRSTAPTKGAASSR
jgi:hypothetical protein